MSDHTVRTVLLCGIALGAAMKVIGLYFLFRERPKMRAEAQAAKDKAA